VAYIKGRCARSEISGSIKTFYSYCINDRNIPLNIDEIANIFTKKKYKNEFYIIFK